MDGFERPEKMRIDARKRGLGGFMGDSNCFPVKGLQIKVSDPSYEARYVNGVFNFSFHFIFILRIFSAALHDRSSHTPIQGAAMILSLFAVLVNFCGRRPIL